MVLCKTLQNEAADFKLEELPVQLTSDWVVTLQQNSVKVVTRELTVNVPGVSKACQLRGWIYLAAHFHLSVMYLLEELGSCSLSTECSLTC